MNLLNQNSKTHEEIKYQIWLKANQQWASQVVLVVKNPPANAEVAREMDSILGLG